MAVRHPSGAGLVGHPHQPRTVSGSQRGRRTRRARRDTGRGRVVDRSNTEARRRPAADDRLARGRHETRDRHLEHERRHVLVGQVVSLDVFRAERIGDVDEIERLAEVDDEGVLALTDEHPPVVAAGNQDVVDVIIRVGRILRNGLAADVVDRLSEHHCASGRVRDRLAHAVAPIAADDADREALLAVERGGGAGVRPDLSDVDQRDRDQQVADRHGQVLDERRRPELKGDVLDRVGVVVDVDFVDGAGVQVEVVWTAVRILQREIVGDQRDVRAAIGFVAAEHVEVRAIELWRLGDAGRFAMTRALSDCAAEQDESRDRSRSSSGEPHKYTSFHPYPALAAVSRRARPRALASTTEEGSEWIGRCQSAVFSRQSLVAVLSPSRQSTVTVDSRLLSRDSTGDSDCRL